MSKSRQKAATTSLTARDPHKLDPIGAVVRIRPVAPQLRKIPQVARDTPAVVARRPRPLDA